MKRPFFLLLLLLLRGFAAAVATGDEGGTLALGSNLVCPMDPLFVTFSGLPHTETLSLDYDGAVAVDWRFAATWTTAPPGPDANATLAGTRALFADTSQPGNYTLSATEGGLRVALTVRPWSACGYASDSAVCATEADCAGSACVGGRCICDAGTFAPDCARGCRRAVTAVAADSGVVASGRYVNGASCAWLLAPPASATSAVASIALDFELFALSRGDWLSVYAPTGDGVVGGADFDAAVARSELLGMFSGGSANATASQRVFRKPRLLLVFSADGRTTDEGFRVAFTAKRVLPSGIIVAIAVSSLLVVAVIASVVVALSRRAVNAKGRRSISAAIAEIMDSAEQEDAMKREVVPLWAQLEESGIRVNKSLVTFGLVGKSVFPLDEERKDIVYITNTSSHTVNFVASLPPGSSRFTFSLRVFPGRGSVPPKSSVPVTICCSMHFTAKINKRIRLQFFTGKQPSTSFGTGFLEVQVEGALSDRLDPDEIVLFTPPIADGNYGVCYRALYRSRICAVKVLKRQSDLTEKEYEDFCAETDLYRRLRGPFICEYIGATYIPGRLSLVTELLSRGNLENLLLHEDAPLPYLLVLKFAQDIAEAMVFLHSNNVLYRDLKPSNVLIVSNSTSARINCKITDFGTAKNVQNASEIFRHSVGQGTPIYMSPEVLATEGYNTKADVYSFGVSLWQMFTRKVPWSHVVCWNVPALVIKGERLPIPSDCPESFAKLIRDCCGHLPKDRPPFSQLVGTIEELVRKEKRNPVHKAIPAPERTAEQLREMRMIAEMSEQRPSERSGSSHGDHQPSTSASAAAAAAAAVSPRQRPVSPAHFRSPVASESRQTRALSLGDADDDLGISPPPLNGQGSIRLSRIRKTSTRSIMTLLAEEQRREALEAAAEAAAAVQEEQEAAEKQRMRKKKKKRHSHHKKKRHSSSGRAHDPTKQGDEIEPLAHVQGDEENPATSSQDATATATPSQPQQQQQSTMQSPPVRPILSPEPLAPQPNRASESRAEDLLMMRAPMRRRPSWDLGSIADAVAFKKIENTKFRSFRRGKTVARLGETPTTTPAIV